MKLINYLKRAHAEKWAIGQFNFSTLDQLKSILDASLKLKSPVIVGTSKGEADFFGMDEAAMIVSFYRKKYKAPFFLNLDHGRDLELIKKAIDSGYDMVHFDGSKMSLDDNIKETKRVLNYAKKKGIVVEGEVGYISGISSLHKKKADIKKVRLAPMEDIIKFSKNANIDLLALSVGNVHGVYSQMPQLDFNLIKNAGVNSAKMLVLHGGSGIESGDIKKAIKLGIVKINVNTELRMAWKESLKRSVAEKDSFAPYSLLAESKLSVTEKVEEKIKLFGSSKRS